MNGSFTSVATSYVGDAVGTKLDLRSERFGQAIVSQQIPLDAIFEEAYDPLRSVSSKFQG